MSNGHGVIVIGGGDLPPSVPASMDYMAAARDRAGQPLQAKAG
jgi:hypothetical protein